MTDHERRLTACIRKKALAQGTVTAGFTKIGKVKPLDCFAYHFSGRREKKRLPKTTEQAKSGIKTG